MAKVIAVSGPQGSGKTTLLNGIDVLDNDRVVIDNFKVSRDVQKRMGAEALSKMTEYPSIMMEFQKNIRQNLYHLTVEVKLLRKIWFYHIIMDMVYQRLSFDHLIHMAPFKKQAVKVAL